MLTPDYLRRQAALCLRLAAAADDQNVIAALVVLANDFSVKADDLDPSLEAYGEPAVAGSQGAGSNR
jgi:hypothetical protein